jgi:hypothetical protein
MRKFLFFLLLLSGFFTKSQTYVKIPDANFVTYLQSFIPSAMKVDSLDITNSLVTTSTQTLNVKGKSISDLTGAQYFTSLTYLDCSSNTLTSLPSLPGGLQYLFCGNNSIVSLPVLPTSLAYLFCDTNQLAYLPSLPNTLKSLSCGFNQLSSFPSFPSSLLSLYCCANYITSLPPLPGSMYYLNCTVNSISSLPALPNSLWYLYMGANNLTSLPTLPSSLKRLWCDYNNLSSIPNLPSGLQYFACYNNSISSLPALPGSLIYLSCENNGINCFPPFPSSITSFTIDPNPYNCLPNYISAMNATDMAKPLCSAGNSNGCPVATGIADIQENISLVIFPNPSDEELTIQTPEDEVNIQVSDLSGRILIEKKATGQKVIDTKNLHEGLYVLSVRTEAGTVLRKFQVLH